MSGRGGHRPGSGRRRIYSTKKECDRIWQRGHRRISLDNIVYSTWVSSKIKCGYSSDSEFASHLLSLEWRRRQNDPVVACAKRKRSEQKDPASSKRSRHIEGHPLSTSTPLKPNLTSVESPNLSFEANGNASDVDVTGISENSQNIHVADGSVVLQTDDDKYRDTDGSSSEGESDDETEETERNLTDALEDALAELKDDCEEFDSSSDISDVDDLEDSICMEENDYDYEVHADVGDIEHEEESSSAASYFALSGVPPSIPFTSSSTTSVQSAAASIPPLPRPPSSLGQPAEISAALSHSLPSSSTPTNQPPDSAVSTVLIPSTSNSLVSVAPTQNSVPSSAPLSNSCASTAQVPSSTTPAPIPTYPKLSRLEDQSTLKEELFLVKQTKVICSLDLLINVFRKCQHPGCTLATTIKHHLNGPTAVINWACPAGHKGTFASSKDQNGTYCNNLQVAGSIMLSGNNFAKVEKMAHFLGLAFISDSTFYRMQRLYFIPAIDEWWGWQREQLLREFRGKEVVVCGDGQCDSPGHTAKNLCYFLMELVSSYILEIEVRDKRHVGLASSNMERQALQNALQRLQASLNIVEVVTDASSTIKKLLADNFATVFHSLDVWHKSKSIRKCLAKVAHLKGMEKIQAWADHIILHFWHSANICKASEATTDDEALEKMKSTWIGLLHHVCNEHDWSGGSCEHGELEEHDLPWFDRREKDFEALQKVVLDSQLLSSFKFYVRFRHTGNLECANNLSLVYTPKRCSYSYRSYKARKKLAAIDWNYHLNQAVATTKAGDMIVSRKYNQRTKEWNSRVVKVKKGYEYIPVLMARIMKLRKEDANKVTRNVPLNDSDPALLAPTIAAKPAPSSKELFLLRKSRFEKANPDESLAVDL